VGRLPPWGGGGAVGPPVGKARVDCMRDIFLLNETWTQGKIDSYFSRHFAWFKYLSLSTGTASGL
jgi:hypothetical protein